MPTGTPLTAVEIQTLRNKAALHDTARKRIQQLEKENKQLKTTVSSLQDRIEEQDKHIAEMEEKIQKIADSKTRFRFFLFGEQKKGKKQNRKKKKKRPKTSYNRPEPKEEEITDRQELVLDNCPNCDGEVSTSQDSYQTCVEDIVFAPKTVTQYTVHRHWCKKCNKLVRAPLPNSLPGMRLGLNTVIFVLIEHYRAKKTDEQIVSSLHTYHHLTVSSGEITAIRHKAADLLGDKYEEIIEAIRAAKVIYADETGWKILGKKGYCWILTASEELVVRYIMADTRGAGIIDDALGENFKGIVVSDFYSVYDNQGSDQQKCWAHLVRETHLLVNSCPDNQERNQLHTELTKIYAAVIRFKEKKWTQRRSSYTETRIGNQLHMTAKHSWQDKECKRIAKRITKYHHQLLTCIRHHNVLPDNNTAERGARTVVTHRKITNGNRSDKGAKTYQVNKSVIETFRLEGSDIVEKLRQTLHQSAWRQKLAPKVM